MIALSTNKTALNNLNITLKALENIDALISEYRIDLPGPAYAIFEYLPNTHKVQFNREIIVTALQAQREKLVACLASLGIDANN